MFFNFVFLLVVLFLETSMCFTFSVFKMLNLKNPMLIIAELTMILLVITNNLKMNTVQLFVSMNGFEQK